MFASGRSSALDRICAVIRPGLVAGGEAGSLLVSWVSEASGGEDERDRLGREAEQFGDSKTASESRQISRTPRSASAPGRRMGCERRCSRSRRTLRGARGFTHPAQPRDRNPKIERDCCGSAIVPRTAQCTPGLVATYQRLGETVPRLIGALDAVAGQFDPERQANLSERT
ncbi:hypothetical protein OM076_27865 [Solirubrobacter ginsenosidimutans]|uniref:Uncharacterized protein n=1 Tax=Solirubrobacter ginsenosidimutans TaxID=490573 RepID=A0A9X3MZK6_9ACTN|nr:hypothetical protein [Solirubrobacter ginsenosidimutans]